MLHRLPPLPCRFAARPARAPSMLARMRRTLSPSPTKIASPIKIVADIELDDLRKARNGRRGRIIEPVAGMHFKAKLVRGAGAGDDAPPLRIRLARAPFGKRLAPRADMNLDGRRADARSGFDLREAQAQ